MLIPQAIKTLQNKAKKKITHQEIANILGLTKQGISSRVHRNQELEQYEWDKLKEFYNYPESNQTNITQSENITADYYSEFNISIKNGKFKISGKKESISFSKKFINNYLPDKKYFVINAIGDSMKPEIKNGDKLIIEISDDNKIKDNNVYIFSYKKQIFVKRLVRNINQISVISDNQDKTIYPTQFINNIDFDNTFLIGKIAGIARDLS